MNTEKMTPTEHGAATVAEWKEIKGMFKTRFGKFSDRDVDNFNGNVELISEKMQSTYGYTKDRADQEYKDFRKSLPIHSETASKNDTAPAKMN